MGISQLLDISQPLINNKLTVIVLRNHNPLLVVKILLPLR